MKAIGVIHTPHRTKQQCPIQPVYAAETPGRVEVFPEWAAGLQDIERFSHIYLVYLFDRAGAVELVRQPFLDDAAHGVFAMRHPCRPNPIGLSVVRLVRREGAVLHVSGVDMLDQTPLLDIKPYVGRFDRVADANDGWVQDQPLRPKPPGRE